MTFLDEFAAANVLGSWAEPLLARLRARRERSRLVFVRQAELLAQLEAALNAAPTGIPPDGLTLIRQWMRDLSEQHSLWQQRQDDYWQQQLALLDSLTEQVADLNDIVQHEPPAAPVTSAKQPATTSSPSASNWEQAKQRLLAELESSTHEGEAHAESSQRAAKPKRGWQLAEKEAEIAELRRQVEQLSQTRTVPVPEAVTNDELVQAELANLRALQQEWQDKLRRAEIEISLERAKLARDKAHLDESKQATTTAAEAKATAPPEDPSKAPRSRWMARLGLLDE